MKIITFAAIKGGVRKNYVSYQNMIISKVCTYRFDECFFITI